MLRHVTHPNPNQTDASAKLARLKLRLKRRGITQIAVAERAGVTKTHVCNVFAGRDPSAKVVLAAKALLAEAYASARAADVEKLVGAAH